MRFAKQSVGDPPSRSIRPLLCAPCQPHFPEWIRRSLPSSGPRRSDGVRSPRAPVERPRRCRMTTPAEPSFWACSSTPVRRLCMTSVPSMPRRCRSPVVGRSAVIGSRRWTCGPVELSPLRWSRRSRCPGEVGVRTSPSVAGAGGVREHPVEADVGTVALPPTRLAVRARVHSELPLVHTHRDAYQAGVSTDRAVHGLNSPYIGRRCRIDKSVTVRTPGLLGPSKVSH